MNIRRIMSLLLPASFLLSTACNSSPPADTPKQKEYNRQTQHAQSSTPAQSADILTTKKLRSLPTLSETDVVKPTNQIREFKLEAKEGRWQLVSGVETEANTFNGTVPGPTIRAKEGDTIRVILKNSLPAETSIHWHGLHVPNKMDGVPSFTQNAIKPGERLRMNLSPITPEPLCIIRISTALNKLTKDCTVF